MKKKAITTGKIIGVIGGLLGILFGIRSYERGFATAENLEQGFSAVQSSISQLSKESRATNDALAGIRADMQAQVSAIKASTHYQMDRFEEQIKAVKEDVYIVKKDVSDLSTRVDAKISYDKIQAEIRNQKIINMLQAKKNTLLARFWMLENKYGGPGVPGSADDTGVQQEYLNLKIEIENIEGAIRDIHGE